MKIVLVILILLIAVCVIAASMRSSQLSRLEEGGHDGPPPLK